MASCQAGGGSHSVVPQHMDGIIQPVQAILHPGLLRGGKGTATPSLNECPAPHTTAQPSSQGFETQDEMC